MNNQPDQTAVQGNDPVELIQQYNQIMARMDGLRQSIEGARNQVRMMSQMSLGLHTQFYRIIHGFDRHGPEACAHCFRCVKEDINKAQRLLDAASIRMAYGPLRDRISEINGEIVANLTEARDLIQRVIAFCADPIGEHLRGQMRDLRGQMP